MTRGIDAAPETRKRDQRAYLRAYYAAHREEARAYGREYARTHREQIAVNNRAKYASRRDAIAIRARATRIRQRGLTPDQLDAMLLAQGGVCAICGQGNTPRRDGRVQNLHIDHDHRCCPSKRYSCGRCVRGLLCQRCNTAVGLLDEDPARLARAVTYLAERSPA